MLTPNYIKKLPKRITKHFRNMEEEVIKEMAKRISTNLRLMENDEYEIKVMLSMGYDVDDLIEAIDKEIKVAAEDIEGLMEEVAKTSYEIDKQMYAAAGKTLRDFEDNIPIKIYLDQVTRESKERILNLTGSTGTVVDNEFKTLKTFYQDTLNRGFLEVSTGLYDHNTAIKRAIDSLGNRGIVSVDYETGRRYSLEGQVRTSIMTGVNQITGYMSERNADDMGQDLMEITAHIGARPSHADWQGQIVDRSGKSQHLSLDDIGYGEADGFKGVNCRHDWYPYFEGISERFYDKEMLDNIDPPPFIYEGREYNAYDASQEQRYLERQMRKWKRKLVTYRAADIDTVAAEIRLRELKRQYEDFSLASGLRAKTERAYVFDY